MFLLNPNKKVNYEIRDGSIQWLHYTQVVYTQRNNVSLWKDCQLSFKLEQKRSNIKTWIVKSAIKIKYLNANIRCIAEFLDSVILYHKVLFVML